jgi:predicted transcriptional regulator YdeE
VKNEIINFPQTKLVGITTRTNNVSEMNPLTAKISSTIQSYMMNKLSSQIQGRARPSVNYCIYTDYESEKITDSNKYEYHGDYTYFIGEEVESFDNVPDDFTKITIPEQKYIKFTTSHGPMPAIVISAWMEIWNMTAKESGATRSFTTDFEVYDERAQNLLNAEVDIYIAVK